MTFSPSATDIRQHIAANRRRQHWFEVIGLLLVLTLLALSWLDVVQFGVFAASSTLVVMLVMYLRNHTTRLESVLAPIRHTPVDK